MRDHTEATWGRSSQVLRRVRERGQEVEVTYRGRVVARLVPIGPERSRPRTPAAAWSILDRVAREIGAEGVLPLVSWNAEQRERATSVVEVLVPEHGA